MARPVRAGSLHPVEFIDDGRTDAEIAASIEAWVNDLRRAPSVHLPVSAADELAAARRAGDV